MKMKTRVDNGGNRSRGQESRALLAILPVFYTLDNITHNIARTPGGILLFTTIYYPPPRELYIEENVSLLSCFKFAYT